MTIVARLIADTSCSGIRALLTGFHVGRANASSASAVPRWRQSIFAVLIAVFLSLPVQNASAQMVPASTSAAELARNTYANLFQGISLDPIRADSARAIILRTAIVMQSYHGTRVSSVSARLLDSVYAARTVALKSLLNNDADRRRYDANVQALSFR